MMFISGDYAGRCIWWIGWFDILAEFVEIYPDLEQGAVHIIVLVHGYKKLRRPRRPRPMQPQKINALSGNTDAIQSTAGWVSLAGFPPDKYPPITLSNGHQELIAEDDFAPLSMIDHCQFSTHTCPGLCWTRRPSRTGPVFVEARFIISYSNLTATQIDSYPTLRKATFIQCDDFGFLGETN